MELQLEKLKVSIPDEENEVGESVRETCKESNQPQSKPSKSRNRNMGGIKKLTSSDDVRMYWSE